MTPEPQKEGHTHYLLAGVNKADKQAGEPPMRWGGMSPLVHPCTYDRSGARCSFV
jgi:hypothetical protein